MRARPFSVRVRSPRVCMSVDPEGESWWHVRSGFERVCCQRPWCEELPKLVEGGEEAEAAPEDAGEEEFDLSDLMGEDLSGDFVSKEATAARVEAAPARYCPPRHRAPARISKLRFLYRMASSMTWRGISGRP